MRTSYAEGVAGGYPLALPTKLLPLPSRTRQSGMDALTNPLSLELREAAAHDAEQQPTRGARGVDVLAQADERHACCIQFLDGCDLVPQVAAESIQPPHDDGIHLPASGIGHQRIERRSAILRAADARVNVFGRVPPTRRAVAPQVD